MAKQLDDLFRGLTRTNPTPAPSNALVYARKSVPVEVGDTTNPFVPVEGGDTGQPPSRSSSPSLTPPSKKSKPNSSGGAKGKGKGKGGGKNQNKGKTQKKASNNDQEEDR